jgi:hypothetical protein
MPVAWPAGLPFGVWRPAYAVQSLGLPPMTSQMQSGKTRMRRQYTRRVATLGYGWRFSVSELATFRSFVTNDLGDGTAEFDMPIWIASAGAYQTRTVQIRGGTSGIAEKPQGVDQTLVSCTLDVQGL